MHPDFEVLDFWRADLSNSGLGTVAGRRDLEASAQQVISLQHLQDVLTISAAANTELFQLFPI